MCLFWFMFGSSSFWCNFCAVYMSGVGVVSLSLWGVLGVEVGGWCMHVKATVAPSVCGILRSGDRFLSIIALWGILSLNWNLAWLCSPMMCLQRALSVSPGHLPEGTRLELRSLCLQRKHPHSMNHYLGPCFGFLK